MTRLASDAFLRATDLQPEHWYVYVIPSGALALHRVTEKCLLRALNDHCTVLDQIRLFYEQVGSRNRL